MLSADCKASLIRARSKASVHKAEAVTKAIEQKNEQILKAQEETCRKIEEIRRDNERRLQKERENACVKNVANEKCGPDKTLIAKMQQEITDLKQAVGKMTGS